MHADAKATFYFIVHGGPDPGDKDEETADLNTSDPRREAVAVSNQGGRHIHYPIIQEQDRNLSFASE